MNTNIFGNPEQVSAAVAGDGKMLL